MTIPTYERLAVVLEKEGLAALAWKARAGQFDDFDERCESATPCIDLVMALRKAGREDLAQRAMNGEWDATKEEGEAWAARQDAEMRDLMERMKHDPE